MEYRVLRCTLCVVAGTVLMLGLVYAAETAQRFDAGKKAKVTGMIQSRNGDLITVKVKKSDAIAIVDLTDNTKFDRKRAFRLRKASMDVTAMVPGLTIDVEGVGNSKGQLEASKITFDPNTFDIEIAQEQQIMDNRAAAQQAQSTANQGVQNAAVAQASADQAQASASQAGDAAAAAGAGVLVNAEAVSLVNKRVSDLGDYKTVGEAAVFFDTGKAALSADDKAALDKIAQDAAAAPNYMIEIAGYASSTGTKALNQQLSDERAAAVANYLRSSANVPMRRILVPAGYGASHPAGDNDTSEGRSLNQRVDVKVLINKGLDQGI